MAMVGLVWGRDGGGRWYVCRIKPSVWSHVGTSRSTSRMRGGTLMTPDLIAVQVHSSGLVRIGIRRSSVKVLTRAPRKGSGSLPMQTVGYVQWWSSDAILVSRQHRQNSRGWHRCRSVTDSMSILGIHIRCLSVALPTLWQILPITHWSPQPK